MSTPSCLPGTLPCADSSSAMPRRPKNPLQMKNISCQTCLDAGGRMVRTNSKRVFRYSLKWALSQPYSIFTTNQPPRRKVFSMTLDAWRQHSAAAKWSSIFRPTRDGATSARTTSARRSPSSRRTASRVSESATSPLIKLYLLRGSNGSMCTVSTPMTRPPPSMEVEPLAAAAPEAVRSRATWDQPPGKQPRSTTSAPSRKIEKRSSICRKLQAALDLYSRPIPREA
mmetsp:Transcript_78823/g.219111  ORF Transcript_78823/g.219111 Transcript_78823/m.219111 type:complete len:227 (+) Transcript_78823:166-846(+)